MKISLSRFAQYRHSVSTIDLDKMTEVVGIRQKLDVRVPSCLAGATGSTTPPPHFPARVERHLAFPP